VKKIFRVALGIIAAIGGFVDIGELVFNTHHPATGRPRDRSRGNGSDHRVVAIAELASSSINGRLVHSS
jgi:hypothetical protein